MKLFIKVTNNEWFHELHGQPLTVIPREESSRPAREFHNWHSKMRSGSGRFIPDPGWCGWAGRTLRRGGNDAGRRVVACFSVRGQNDRAFELFEAVQQIGCLQVGVSVVGVLDLRPLAEEGVGIVEEQDGVRAPRRVLKGSCCSSLPRLAAGLLRGPSKKRLRKRTVPGKVSRRHQGAHPNLRRPGSSGHGPKTVPVAGR
jgi:hypothetical protein